MPSQVFIKCGAGLSRRQAKPIRKRPAKGEQSDGQLLTAWGDDRGYAYGPLKESLEEIIEVLKPGSLTIGAVELPEEILEGLRPGSLTIKGVKFPQKPSRKLSQPLPSTQEIVDKFLVAKQVKVRPASLKSYSDTLRPFARRYPTLPAKPEQIEEYLTHYGNENTTAKNIYIIIRLLYNFAQKRNLLPFPNPITTVEKPGGKPKPPEHTTINQAQALCKAIRDDRERALVYCLFGQGLRLKETRLITVADVGQDTILVHGKEREEPMPLITEVRDALLKLADGKRPDEFIFSGRHGQPLSDSMLQLIVKNLFTRAGISGIRSSPHTLRHSRGVITDIAGLDSYSSRRLLRHTTTQMTDRYSALNLEELRQKEERYNPLRVLFRLDQELGKKPDFAQFKANAVLSEDPAELLPELLDRLIALGQLAYELRHALGGNGHRLEQLSEISRYLEHQAENKPGAFLLQQQPNFSFSKD